MYPVQQLYFFPCFFLFGLLLNAHQLVNNIFAIETTLVRVVTLNQKLRVAECKLKELGDNSSLYATTSFIHIII